MNEKRLLRLAGLLEKHADNGIRFDLCYWRFKGKERKRGVDWCGTKACAVGLAMGDRGFKAQGLKVENTGVGEARPTFNGFRGMSAAAAFFDVSFDDACKLFDPCSYSGKTYGDVAARKVAKRIHQSIKGGGSAWVAW